jgi:hypothetical protein
MRWPNRKPHVLTAGMRRAQLALAGFLPLIDWPAFRRVNLNREVEVTPGGDFAAFACGDSCQAVVWLLRTKTIAPDRRLDRNAAPHAPTLRVPGLKPATYRVTGMGYGTRGGAGDVPSPRYPRPARFSRRRRSRPISPLPFGRSRHAATCRSGGSLVRLETALDLLTGKLLIDAVEHRKRLPDNLVHVVVAVGRQTPANHTSSTPSASCSYFL